MEYKINLKGITRKDYKSDLDYLREVYRRNKNILLRGQLTTIKASGLTKEDLRRKNPEKIFIDRVLGFKESDGINIRAAISRTINSETITARKERYKNNLYKAIVSDKYAYKAFRGMTRNLKGQFTKIDPRGFTYIRSDVDLFGKEYALYKYESNNSTVYIKITNSPKKIEMNFEEFVD